MKVERNPQKTHRYHELDGIRGLAAISVGFWHSMVIWVTLPFSVYATISKSIFCGSTAVDVFFVLSGFVLPGMISSITQRYVFEFYLRRLIRLYLPVFASVSLFVLFLLSCRGYGIEHSGNHIWADYFNGGEYLSVRSILENLTAYRYVYNPVLWTIRVEIFVSIVFPILFYYWNRQKIAQDIILLFILVVVAIIFKYHDQYGLVVLHYLYVFYMGMIVRKLPIIKFRNHKIMTYLSLLLILLLVLNAANYRGVYNSGDHPVPYDFVTSLLVSCLIYFVIVNKDGFISGALRSEVIQFSGMISYSYYLINYLFILLTAIVLNHYNIQKSIGLWPSVLILSVLSLAVTIPFAYMFHVVIERPSVYIGRMIKNRQKLIKQEFS